MPRTPGDVTAQVEPVLPAYRVAVVRSESESLHNPARDIVGMLEDRDQWRYRLFNEHTFDSLLEGQRDFDCIVIGYNATYQNPGLLSAINSHNLKTGVVLLHQISGEFHLTDDLALETIKLPHPRTDIAASAGRDADLEIVLNWPERVTLAQLNASAVCALEPEPGSPWRPVLSVGNAQPVLLRSSLARRPSLVATSLLLEPGRPEHERLLRNLIVYAAAGPPETVVLAAPDSQWQGTLVRKLRLRRVNALEVPPTASLRYDRWPLRALSDVVTGSEQPTIPDESRWLDRGGRRTTVDPASGAVTIRSQASDLQWVARRWSAWLQSSAAAELLSRVTTTCVYLRTLHTLGEILAEDLDRFGLAPADEHTRIAQLLERRLGNGDNLEDSVGPTAAVLEIDRTVGGLLPAAQRERIEAWLRRQVTDVSVEDVLEVSRVLADGTVLDGALDRVDGRLTVATLSRLRLAAVACKRPLSAFAISPVAHETILAELLSSLLAAADYLSSAALYDRFLNASGDPDPAAARSNREDALIDAAIGTLTKRGTLASEEPIADASLEEVCAEALALACYLAVDRVSTGELARSEAVAPQLLDTVLVEGLRLRQEDRALRGQLSESSRALRNARTILGVLTLAIAAAAGWFTHEGLSGVLGETVAPFGAAALAIGILGALLTRLGVCPSWLIKVFEGAQEGFKGLLSPFRSLLDSGRRNSDHSSTSSGPPPDPAGGS